MRSSFFEFNVAVTGLNVARAGLEITSHNIANAARPEYSRQYLEQRAGTPLSYNNGKGMIGTGAQAYGIGQHRSLYLDKKYWAERTTLGGYSVKSTQLSILEGLLNEQGDTGLIANFNNFFEQLHDLKTNAGDDTYRASVIKIAQSLTTHITSVGGSLRKQQQDINSEVKTTVELINTLGTQIRNLNEQIYKYESDGSNANDLRDSRAALIDELSLYVNIDVTEKEYNEDYEKGKYPEPEDRHKSDKKLSITINGYEFINHLDVTTLRVEQRATGDKKNDMDSEGLYDIYFNGSNMEFDIYSTTLKGELKSLIEMRDGNNGKTTTGNTTTKYKGIPHYMNKLNELIRTFSQGINKGIDKNGNPIKGLIGHEAGYDRNGNLGESLFTDGTGGVLANYNDITFDNFAINENIVKDTKLIAAAQEAISDESDNRVILSFFKMKSYDGLFREGKLEDYVIGMTSELGIDKKHSDNFTKNYTDVVSSINNERIAVHGVSVNEETVNLVKYNQLYQASAKLINIIDGIYDTCINRLGTM